MNYNTVTTFEVSDDLRVEWNHSASFTVLRDYGEGFEEVDFFTNYDVTSVFDAYEAIRDIDWTNEEYEECIS